MTATMVRERAREVTIPSLTITREDMAYLDFAGSLRGFLLRELVPLMKRDYRRRVEERVAAGGKAPETLDEVSAFYDRTQAARWRGHLLYQSQQQRVWRLHELAAADRERLAAAMAEPIEDALGSLELDDSIRLPAYYEQTYFHTAPSGYWRGEWAGLTYDLGLAIYQLQPAGSDLAESFMVSALPDGNYRDILDLGCGTGAATLPLKRRWPEARVVGIDVAAPMLRMAHRKAERAGLAIDFMQRLAEHTGFPEASFDLVFAQILFHEVPTDAAEQIMREACRVLRPGGLFAIADVEPYHTLDPFDRYMTDWQTENNEEPFWRVWGESDGPAMLRAAGFAEAWLVGLDNPRLPGRKQYLTVGRK